MAGHNVSPLREGALCLCLISLVLTFIALIGVEWAVPSSGQQGGGSSKFEGLGLWRLCYRDDPGGGVEVHYVCTSLASSTAPGWMKAVQAMIVLAVIFYSLSFLLIIMFTCCASWRQERRLIICFIVGQPVAAIFNMVGVSVFAERLGSAFPEQLTDLAPAWCFIISCVSIGLAFVTVLLAVLDMFRDSAKVPMQRFDNELETQPPTERNGDPGASSYQDISSPSSTQSQA